MYYGMLDRIFDQNKFTKQRALIYKYCRNIYKWPMSSQRLKADVRMRCKK